MRVLYSLASISVGATDTKSYAEVATVKASSPSLGLLGD